MHKNFDVNNYIHVFDSINLIVFICEASNLKIIYANKKAFEVTEFKDLSDFNSNKFWSRFKKPYSFEDSLNNIKNLKEKGSIKLERMCREKNGEEKWYEVESSYLKIGQIEYVCSIASDITETKRNREELKESKAAMSLLATVRDIKYESCEFDLWQAFLNKFVSEYDFCMAWYGIINDNQTIKPLFCAGNYCPADFNGDTAKKSITAACTGGSKCALINAIKSGQPFSYPDMESQKCCESLIALGYKSNCAINVKIDGKIEGGAVFYSLKPNDFSDLRVKNLQAIINEIENLISLRRKNIQNETMLVRSENMYRSLAEISKNIIFMVNYDGRILYVNKYAAPLIGKKNKDFISDFQHKLFNDKTGDKYLEKIKDVFKTGETHSTEEEITEDGETIWINMQITPIKDNAEKVAAALVILQDVTKVKNYELDLKRAKESAEEANQAKSRFLANMSHEIRTPLNSVLGFTELLIADPLARDEQKIYLSNIKSSGKHLLSIINDLLDLSKIEAGKFTIENVEVDLLGVLDRVINVVTPEVKIKKLNINVIISPDLYFIKYKGDPVRLTQVVLNLVNNAIKYSEKGKIEIRAILVNDDANESTIKFEVIDEGIGIKEEFLEKIFLPFIRGERKAGGTGLGLSVSNRLVKLMGGERIFVNSKFGEGSHFYFSLRFEKSSAATSIKSAPNVSSDMYVKKMKTYKVLVAEDNELNMTVVTGMLSILGHNYETVNDGEKAVEILKESKKKRKNFDFVLMDVQMPELDGLGATKKLRDEGFDIPIVAMTAYSMQSDIDECITAGMNFHVSKPFDIDEIKAVIEKIDSFYENQ